MRRRRLCSAFHIERSIANRLGLPEYPCACRRCRGARIRSEETVTRHHRKYGRDAYLPYPVLTVDGHNLRGPVARPHGGEEYYDRGARRGGGRHYAWPRRPEMDVRRMVFEAYGRADSLHRDAAEDHGQTMFPDSHPLDDISAEGNIDFANLLQECTEPVYESCAENRMQAGIVLMTLASVFGVSDNYLTAILTYFAGNILPRSNFLPRTAYELKNMIRKLGLEHERTDCCPQGHVLFEGPENGHLKACPRCNHPRFIQGSKDTPQAVSRYFPLIPKLERLSGVQRLQICWLIQVVRNLGVVL